MLPQLSLRSRRVRSETFLKSATASQPKVHQTLYSAVSRCYSLVGRKLFPQDINLGVGCVKVSEKNPSNPQNGRSSPTFLSPNAITETNSPRPQHRTAIHEIGHAVGLFHEQSRRDRDKFIKILWENVDPSMKNQFRKLDDNPRGVPYDYRSVMQYSELVSRARSSHLQSGENRVLAFGIEQSVTPGIQQNSMPLLFDPVNPTTKRSRKRSRGIFGSIN